VILRMPTGHGETVRFVSKHSAQYGMLDGAGFYQNMQAPSAPRIDNPHTGAIGPGG